MWEKYISSIEILLRNRQPHAIVLIYLRTCVLTKYEFVRNYYFNMLSVVHYYYYYYTYE